jgi:hypothetical protein
MMDDDEKAARLVADQADLDRMRCLLLDLRGRLEQVHEALARARQLSLGGWDQQLGVIDLPAAVWQDTATQFELSRQQVVEAMEHAILANHSPKSLAERAAGLAYQLQATVELYRQAELDAMPDVE